MSEQLNDQGHALPILAQIAAEDPEIADRMLSRRSAILRGASTSTAVAAALGMASVPVAMAALAHDAFGQTTRLPATVVTILNFALTLEYLESQFYTTGVNKTGLIPAIDQPVFASITKNETTHVNTIVGLLGSSARPKPTFDYSAGKGSGIGPYADVFTNYATFTAVAQAFEDTGVRAYKGQAPALIPYKDVLTAALTIHSVEARHASILRRIRGNFQETAPHKGWITGAQTDIPGTAANYAGEDNLMQGGLDVSTLPGSNAMSATEAFDEPLTMAQVLSIVSNFIAA